MQFAQTARALVAIYSIASQIAHHVTGKTTMALPPTFLSRRGWLQRASLVTAAAASPSWAQPGKPAASTRSVAIAQLIDFSGSQQDVSKDFLIGSRAAWQGINARGGIRGRQVSHLAVETDDKGWPSSPRDWKSRPANATAFRPDRCTCSAFPKALFWRIQ